MHFSVKFPRSPVVWRFGNQGTLVPKKVQVEFGRNIHTLVHVQSNGCEIFEKKVFNINACLQAVTLGCSHSYCEFCINSWKSKCYSQSQCPICRKPIKTEVRSIVLDQYINRIVEKLDEELVDVRNEIVQQRRGKPCALVKLSEHERLHPQWFEV